MQRIMIIRHGEKPGDSGPDRGVTYDGVHDRHDLTVRGWQRAGALVRFFAPAGGWTDGAAISTPVSILASAAMHGSPSNRAHHTVEPLAAMLGIAIDTAHANGEEADAAAALLTLSGPVLIAWHHHHIPRLAALISGGRRLCPAHWPDDRFDLVWVLDRSEDGGWNFAQVAQLLLAGDRADLV